MTGLKMCPACGGTVYLDEDRDAPALVCRQGGHRWFIGPDGSPYVVVKDSKKRPWVAAYREFDGMRGKKSLPPTVSVPSTWSRPRHTLG